MEVDAPHPPPPPNNNTAAAAAPLPTDAAGLEGALRAAVQQGDWTRALAAAEAAEQLIQVCGLCWAVWWVGFAR